MFFSDETEHPRARQAGATISINNKTYIVIEEVFLHPEAGNTLDLVLPAHFNGVALVEDGARKMISFLEPNSIELFDRTPERRIFETDATSIREALAALSATNPEAQFILEQVEAA